MLEIHYTSHQSVQITSKVSREAVTSMFLFLCYFLIYFNLGNEFLTILDSNIFL